MYIHAEQTKRASTSIRSYVCTYHANKDVELQKLYMQKNTLKNIILCTYNEYVGQIKGSGRGQDNNRIKIENKLFKINNRNK